MTTGSSRAGTTLDRGTDSHPADGQESHDPATKGGNFLPAGRSRNLILIAIGIGILLLGWFLLSTLRAGGVGGKLQRVSVASDGSETTANSFNPSLSSDGGLVAFESAGKLVESDGNGRSDVYIYHQKTRKIELVSLSSSVEQSNGESETPAISSDGSRVTFVSEGDNLVPEDTNDRADIFVRDLGTGKTERVNISNAGAQADGDSETPGLSADGRLAVFTSWATNLVPGDTNGNADIFLRDLETGKTERVSLSETGEQARGDSELPAISADGRYLAFRSDAPNLVAGDTNGIWDVFRRDLKTGKIERVNVSSVGEQAGREDGFPFGSQWLAISADGRHVTFMSWSTNLVPNDTNREADVFVRDMEAGKTERVSISSNGRQGDERSRIGMLSISADGRYVAIRSAADNLTAGDSNKDADVLVFDRRTRKIVRVHGDADREKNDEFVRHEVHGLPVISPNGRWVTFRSSAKNFVPGDKNEADDIFIVKVDELVR